MSDATEEAEYQSWKEEHEYQLWKAEHEKSLKAKEKVGYGEFSASEMLANEPESRKQVIEDYKYMLTHPFETINTMGDMVWGGVENIGKSVGLIDTEAEPTRQELVADAVGKYAKEPCWFMGSYQGNSQNRSMGCCAGYFWSARFVWWWTQNGSRCNKRGKSSQ